jgi:hypothetical protein
MDERRNQVLFGSETVNWSQPDSLWSLIDALQQTGPQPSVIIRIANMTRPKQPLQKDCQSQV